MVLVVRQRRSQALQSPTGIPFGAEEGGALIIVYPGDLKALAIEILTDFRPDQTAGAGDERRFPHRNPVYELNEPRRKRWERGRGKRQDQEWRAPRHSRWSSARLQ